MWQMITAVMCKWEKKDIFSKLSSFFKAQTFIWQMSSWKQGTRPLAQRSKRKQREKKEKKGFKKCDKRKNG